MSDYRLVCLKRLSGQEDLDEHYYLMFKITRKEDGGIITAQVVPNIPDMLSGLSEFREYAEGVRCAAEHPVVEFEDLLRELRQAYPVAAKQSSQEDVSRRLRQTLQQMLETNVLGQGRLWEIYSESVLGI